MEELTALKWNKFMPSVFNKMILNFFDESYFFTFIIYIMIYNFVNFDNPCSLSLSKKSFRSVSSGAVW